jgi:serine/threonine-protein kinase CTR1
MSPECARGDQYNAKVDVYTFGLLCYELLSLVKPYSDLPSDLGALVFYGGVRPECPTNWPVDIRKLLCSCWSQDLERRPTMKEAQVILQKELLMLTSQSNNVGRTISIKAKESIEILSSQATSRA